MRAMAAASVATAFAASAAMAGPVPAGGTHILDGASAPMSLAGMAATQSINHLEFDSAVRLTSRTQGSTNKWSSAARWTSTGAVKTGDVLLVRFLMRCADTRAADRKGVVVVAFGSAQAPYVNCLVTRATSDQEWREHRFAFVSGRDHGPGDAKLAIACGMELQSVEIGGVGVWNYGTSKRVTDFETSAGYAGMEEGAAWRGACLEWIDRIRRGPVEVRVLDAAGRPVAGAAVRLAMTRHEFGFGCTFNPHVSRMAPQMPAAVAEYGRRFEEYLNLATPEAVMNWRGWETPGHREALAKAMDWLESRAIPVIGHPMVWQPPKVLPDRVQAMLKAKDHAGYIAAWDAHLREKAVAMRGRLCEHLVINEFVDTNFLPEDLTDDAIVRWYGIVKEADPAARLGILDHHMIGYGAVDADRTLPWYEGKIAMLLRRGVPLEIIAFQGHFRDVLTDPERALAILDRFAKFGLELQITEFDVEMDNEDLQARYLRDFFIAAFSHPSVRVLQQWGFHEPTHWRPRAALFRADWTPKPAGRAFLELVHGRWRTDTNLVTGADGRCAAPAFFGTYSARVASGGIVRQLAIAHTNRGVTRVEFHLGGAAPAATAVPGR